MHFSDGADVSSEYSYDVNGNLIKDLNRNISLIQYNILNLPKKISFSNGAFEEMTYSANGEKLQVRKKNIAHGVDPGTGGLVPFPDPGPGPAYVRGTANKASRATPAIFSNYSTTDYCGNIVYKDDQLSRISFDGGYVTFGNDGNPDYHFYLTDHLGSNRMVLSSTGIVEQQNFYYPFGASRSDSKNKGLFQPYKYNGKELDSYENIFSYDYGARLYDPILCRFMQPDPLAEKYYSISPYAYCFNDPVNKVDPDGKRPKASEAALMAAYAYGDNSELYGEKLKESGWVVSHFPTNIKMNYTRFNQNGLQSVLFQRTIEGVTEYAYAYAGTNSIEDAVEDVVQLAGIAPQYHTAIHNARTLSQELSDNELTFVGHSLGGGEAIASSMATGRAAITFNAAAISELTKIVEDLNKYPNVVNYRAIGTKIGIGNIRIGGDVLNNIQEKVGLSLPGITIGIPTGIFPTHTISEFLKQKLPEP